jgi:hypothetical protein
MIRLYDVLSAMDEVALSCVIFTSDENYVESIGLKNKLFEKYVFTALYRRTKMEEKDDDTIITDMKNKKTHTQY